MLFHRIRTDVESLSHLCIFHTFEIAHLQDLVDMNLALFAYLFPLNIGCKINIFFCFHGKERHFFAKIGTKSTFTYYQNRYSTSI